jgi:hypothetical protein
LEQVRGRTALQWSTEVDASLQSNLNDIGVRSFIPYGAPKISMAYGRAAVLISKLERCLERETVLCVPFGPGSRRVAPGAAPSPRTNYGYDLPARLRPSG